MGSIELKSLYVLKDKIINFSISSDIFKMKEHFDELIISYSNRVVNTNAISLIRSILALSLLLSIWLEGTNLFPDPYLENLRNQSLWAKYNLFLILPSSEIKYSIFISILILLLVITGFLPKITSLLHFWVAISFLNTSIIIEGGDQIATTITLLLIPIILIDKRKNLWSDRKIKYSYFENISCNFFLLIIKTQMCVLYFHAAIGKLIIDEWLDGTALYYWITHNIFGVHPSLKIFFEHLLKSPYFTTTITWSVILIELLLSVSFFFTDKLKETMLKLGLFFHLLIFLLMGLFNFWLYMSACLILYLYPVHKPININFAKWKILFKPRKFVKTGF